MTYEKVRLYKASSSGKPDYYIVCHQNPRCLKKYINEYATRIKADGNTVRVKQVKRNVMIEQINLEHLLATETSSSNRKKKK